MKKCEYKRSGLLVAYTKPDEQGGETEFQRHLLSCEECREDLAQLCLMVHSIGEERTADDFIPYLDSSSFRSLYTDGRGEPVTISLPRKETAFRRVTLMN